MRNMTNRKRDRYHDHPNLLAPHPSLHRDHALQNRAPGRILRENIAPDRRRVLLTPPDPVLDPRVSQKPIQWMVTEGEEITVVAISMMRTTHKTYTNLQYLVI